MHSVISKTTGYVIDKNNEVFQGYSYAALSMALEASELLPFELLFCEIFAWIGSVSNRETSSPNAESTSPSFSRNLALIIDLVVSRDLSSISSTSANAFLASSVCPRCKRSFTKKSLAEAFLVSSPL